MSCHYSCVFYQRCLPHWQPPSAPVFLTWHLKGSLPRGRYPPTSSASAGRAFLWMDRFLDTARSGPLWLRMSPVATLVVDAIAFGQDELKQYRTGAFVVMPNHVHLLVIPSVPIPRLTRRLKGYTAREANRILGRTGQAFWQPSAGMTAGVACKTARSTPPQAHSLNSSACYSEDRSV